MTQEVHYIEIFPPLAWDKPYTIKCSFGDLGENGKGRTTMHHAEAKEIAWGHGSDVAKKAANKAKIADWDKD
jgi:hypothetical protein